MCINITNLGTVSIVLVGKTLAPIVAQDTDFVIILLPPLGDGVHQIYLNVLGKGYLVTDTYVTVIYILFSYALIPCFCLFKH